MNTACISSMNHIISLTWDLAIINWKCDKCSAPSTHTQTQCIWFCSIIGEYFWKAYTMTTSNAYISNKKYLSAFIFSIRWGWCSFLPWLPTKVFSFFERKTNIRVHQFSPECGALGTNFHCLLLLRIVSILESHLPFKTKSNYADIK